MINFSLSKKSLLSLFCPLILVYSSFGQIICGHETRAISCIVNNYKIVNDTFVSIIPDTCNYPILKDTINGTWKFVSLNNSFFEIFTIVNGEKDGWDKYYHDKLLTGAYYYQNGKLKKEYKYYNNGNLYSTSIKYRLKNGDYSKAKDTYWDKEGNKVEREKAFQIWLMDYCK